jgi:hypothetical protein
MECNDVVMEAKLLPSFFITAKIQWMKPNFSSKDYNCDAMHELVVAFTSQGVFMIMVPKKMTCI